jgi:hypothetical protein
LGQKIVAERLRAAGAHVECMTDHFAEDTPDAVWLAEVGRRGWIVLSKDKYLRHNLLEVVALLRSNTYAFVLTSGNDTGREMAAAFLAAMKDMKEIIARMPPPLLGRVSKSGKVTITHTHFDLIKRAKP